MFVHEPGHHGITPLPSSRDLVPSGWLGLAATARNWPLTGGGLGHVPQLSSLVAVLGFWHNSADFVPTASLRTKDAHHSRLATTRPSAVGMTQLSGAGKQPVHFRKANKHFGSPTFLGPRSRPVCSRRGYFVEFCQSCAVILSVEPGNYSGHFRSLQKMRCIISTHSCCHTHRKGACRRTLRKPCCSRGKANTVRVIY